MSNRRLRLREDAYWAKTETGTVILTHRGPATLAGASVHEWIDRLEPHLDGSRNLASLTASLSPERREFVEKLVATLLELDVVREVGDDEEHRLTDDECARYRPEIDFIGYFHESAARSFQRYRESTVLVAGAGVLVPAVVRALLLTGSRSILVESALSGDYNDWRRDSRQRVECLNGAMDDASMLAMADVVMHVSDRPMADRAWQLERLAAVREIPIGHAVVIGAEAWLSPVTRVGYARQWSDGWRRMAGLGLPAGTESPPLSAAAISVVANQFAQGMFSAVTGVQPPETHRLTRVDLSTYRSETHKFVPHPFSVPAQAEEDASFFVRIRRLQHGGRLDVEEFSRGAVRLMDSRLGVFSEITEGDLAQLPLRVASTRVADPVGLGQPTDVAGGALDWATARHEVALRALAVYGARMVDPHRVVVPDGEPLLMGEPDPGQIRAAVGSGRILAYDLTDGRPALVPARQAFPVLGGSSCGVAAAFTWEDALERGLLGHCRQLTVAEVVASDASYPRVDQEAIARDDETRHYLTLLAAIGEPIAVYDVTGRLGVPTVACCRSGRTVAYECGRTMADALRSAMKTALLSYQAETHEEPVYAPFAVPDLPVSRRGDHGSALPHPPLAVSDLAVALSREGHRAFAVPLDHDPQVHRVMPYLVHVVVTDDSN